MTRTLLKPFLVGLVGGISTGFFSLASRLNLAAADKTAGFAKFAATERSSPFLLSSVSCATAAAFAAIAADREEISLPAMT